MISRRAARAAGERQRLIHPYVLLILVGLGLGCSGDRPADGDAGELAAPVSEFLDRYVRAIEARDSATILESYVEGDRFVWLEDGEARYQDGSEVLRSLDAFPPGVELTTALGVPSVVRVGVDAAHAWVPFHTTVGTGASQFGFAGVMTFALERSGTTWKIVAGHTSTLRTREGGQSD